MKARVSACALSRKRWPFSSSIVLALVSLATTPALCGSDTAYLVADHSQLDHPPPQYRLVIKDSPAEKRFDLTLISSDDRSLCVSVGGWPDGLGHVDWGSSWVKLSSESRIFPARDWNLGYCEGNDCSHRIKANGTLTGFIGYAEFGNPKEIAALPDRRLLFETTAYACPNEMAERSHSSNSTSTRTLALISSSTEARLGSSIDDFLSAWGTPSDEESLVRTANLKWKRLPASFESIVPDVFAAEVAFLDGIACEIVLRSKQRITRDKMIRLAKPILPHFRAADFAKPRSDVNGIRIYALEDGTSVSVNEHKGYFVIVIKGQCYLGNEEVFDREAAKVRPPTSNH